MKIITVQIELGISHFDLSDMNNKEAIVAFLNHKLYHDPAWFGDFGEENIVSIVEGI